MASWHPGTDERRDPLHAGTILALLAVALLLSSLIVKAV